MESRQFRMTVIVLLAGFIIGAVSGLIYAWAISPVTFVDIAPAQLGDADQQIYIRLVAEAYQYEQDIARARARLQGLGVRDISDVVKVQADSAYLRGAPLSEICALSLLAQGLGTQTLASQDICADINLSEPGAGSTVAPDSLAITPTILQTPTDLPSLTPFIPTAPPPLTLSRDFSLIGFDDLCVGGTRAGLIEVYVLDAFENGVPGVAVLVEWDGGDNQFFTGFKPEVSEGYADFEMEPELEYTVILPRLSPPVEGLNNTSCTSDENEETFPTYVLVFAPTES